MSEIKTTENENTRYKALNYKNVKAMWLSQYDLTGVYTDNGTQREKSDFASRMSDILDNVCSLGINTVIVQVRPNGDSFYPSDYYPMSSYTVGAYGREADYDPFGIVVSLAHEKGLSVHAWINPLRAMLESEITDVPKRFAIRKWYDEGKRVLREVDGRIYLNPAYSEARRLIADGAAEIASEYDVDGVHMDDYFYPTTETSFDDAEYADYKKRGGILGLDAYRRDNVNKLVREIYSAVKRENESVLFGISPAGVMSNNYNLLYADVAEWCRGDGYIDYICPQVYFGFEHASCDFVKVCREFSGMITRDDVKLIIGMTLGKACSEYDTYAGEKGKYEWRDNKDILSRELTYASSIDKCSGVCYFCYQYFFDPLTGAEVSKTAAEREKLIPLLKTAKFCSQFA